MTYRQQIRELRSGQPVTSLRQPLNDLIRQVNDLTNLPGGPRVATSLLPNTLRVFEIKAFGAGPDFEMTCVLPGQSANVDAQEWTVYPPYTFVVTSRDGVSYSYADINNRVADGTDSHEMTPKYLVGDRLLAVYEPVENRFYDVNVDGRMWAKL